MLTLASRAILAGPTIHVFRFHTRLPCYAEEPWPDAATSQLGLNDVVTDVELTPSTNRGDPKPTTPSPHEIFKSWKLNSFYSPLDFLRSRRMRVLDARPRARALVGPGAQEALYNDAFRQLDINPLEETNNSVLLGHFITGMGKIRPRSVTGLSWRSQRMVAKAIKRAKQKGIMAISSSMFCMNNTK